LGKVTRYRVRQPQPRAYFDDWEGVENTPFVTMTCDHQSIFTGLLDADGNEIWRDPEPIGFHSPLDS
jgi:hypothetical protein